MRKIKYIILGLAVLVLFAGCGNSEGTTSTSSGSSSTAKTKIVVGTSGAPKPYTYANENGDLKGYDIDVVKAIFKKLPQYEVSFEKTEFASVLSGLDSDRYQIGANNFAKNAEREKKYIYTDAIFKNQFVIAVAEDNEDIKSFADLAGKSTEVSPGVNFTTALEKYNEDNPDSKVNINYSEAEMINTLQNVESGKYDFQLIDKAMLQTYIDEYGLKLKAVSLSEEDSNKIAEPYSYLLVSKTDQGKALAEDINKVLKTLIADGTVTKISEKYFKADYAPK